MTTTTTRSATGRFTRGEKEAQAETEALRLRSRGLSYRSIAAATGCTFSTARRRVERALRATIQEPADEVRALELARMDTILEESFAVLGRSHVTVSNGTVVRLDGAPVQDDGPVLAAIDRVLKIMERRAKLLGLDAPAKARIEVVTEDVIDAEIRRLETEIAARGTAGETAAPL